MDSNLPPNLPPYQAYCHIAKNQFVLNVFMERSYLGIPDPLQTFAVIVKLQEKSHQRCLLIHYLCCYLHSRRKIKIILRICKFTRISWILKNRKNFAEYFVLVCYGLFVLSTATINTYMPALVTLQKIYYLAQYFFQFSQFFYFPFFRWHTL